MNLKLVKMSDSYQNQLRNVMDEWYATGEKIIPYAIRKTDYHDFAAYMENLEVTDYRGALVK